MTRFHCEQKEKIYVQEIANSTQAVSVRFTPMENIGQNFRKLSHFAKVIDFKRKRCYTNNVHYHTINYTPANHFCQCY